MVWLTENLFSRSFDLEGHVALWLIMLIYVDIAFNQQRLKTDEYEDIETFSTDVYLLFDNAIKFYQPNVQEHKDAIKLKEVYEAAKARLCSQLDEQSM